MMSTTDIMSAAPLMNAFTKRLSDTPPMTPMMSAMSRNHVEASSKYQLPSGTPVRKEDQAGVTSSSETEVASTGSVIVVVVAPSLASSMKVVISSPVIVVVTSWVVAPASKMVTPRSAQGMNETIMMTKVSANTMSDHFWRPDIFGVAAASSSAASVSDSFMPHSFIMSCCSCSDRKVEPLSAFTFLA